MSHLAELDAVELEKRWHEHHGDEYPNVRNIVKVGHLVVAVLAVIGTIGGAVAGFAYTQADRNARTEKQLEFLRDDNQRQDQIVIDIRRRQEINEARISTLERLAAIEDQRFTAMQADHARIYSAIEGIRTGRR